MKKFVIAVLISLFMLNIIPVVHAEENLLPNARSGLLIEASSGKILFEKNKDTQVAVASMTKMMGLILIMEKLESGEITLDEIVTVSKNASGMGGSQIYLETGEKMSVRDLIKGIAISSANDAVVAMAEKISGSEANFVKAMNAKAEELSLTNTHFDNPHGLDSENHYSTARDMSRLAQELLKHEEILKFTSIYEDYLRVDTPNKFWLVNTNKLVRLYDGADGLKTGFTDAAGYCMAVTAKRNGMRLIAVVLGEPKGSIRNEETSELLDYGFNNYKVMNLKEKDSIIDNIKFDKSTKDNVNIYLKDDASVLMKQSDNTTGFDTETRLNQVKLPLKSGDIVGQLLIKKNDEVIDEIDLIVKDDVQDKSWFQLFIEVLRDTLV